MASWFQLACPASVAQASGLAWLGLAWLGLAWPSLALEWLGLAWLWLALALVPGLVWLGFLVWLAWLGLAP